MILLLEDNVMFSMPVMDIARQHHQEVQIAASAEEVLPLLAGENFSGILLDMRLITEDLIKAMGPHRQVAAFGPHVDGEKFIQLRHLGIREVWPNSKLREKLPHWLSTCDV